VSDSDFPEHFPAPDEDGPCAELVVTEDGVGIRLYEDVGGELACTDQEWLDEERVERIRRSDASAHSTIVGDGDD